MVCYHIQALFYQGLGVNDLCETFYSFLCFSSSSSNHELLLNVLWEGVVHTSAQVRSTAARMFEVCNKFACLYLILFEPNYKKGLWKKGLKCICAFVGQWRSWSDCTCAVWSGLHCPLSESLAATECIKRNKRAMVLIRQNRCAGWSRQFLGVVGWCEGAVYLISLGRPTDIGLQLGKACYPCSE